MPNSKLNTVKIWSFVLLIVLLGINISQAQNYSFGPNVRVNDNLPASAFISTFSSGQHLIAARGDTVYIVWRDDRSTSPGIYFARSNDHGQSFLPNVQADRTGDGILPSLAVDELGGIHVAWLGQFIYYAKSTNGGQTFTFPVRASDSSLSSQFGYSTIATSRNGQRVYIAHHNNSGPKSKILLTRSINGGATFIRPDVVVNSDTGYDMLAQSIAVFDDTIVLISWNNGTGSVQGRRIYFARSTNSGASFSPQRIISDTTWGDGNYNSSLAIDKDGKVYVLWSKIDSLGLGLNMVVSQDTGKTFSATRRIPEVIGGQDPSLAVLRNGRIFLAWRSWTIPLPDDVSFTYSSDQGLTFDLPITPSNGPFSSEEKFPTLVANEDGDVYIAWTDSRNDTTDYNRDVYFSTGTNLAIKEQFSFKQSEHVVRILPNPANGKVKIEYTTYQTGPVQIEIINSTGQIIKSWPSWQEKSGYHSLTWNGHDVRNRLVSNGIYFVILRSIGKHSIGKLNLIQK